MIDQGKRNVLGMMVNAFDYEAAVQAIMQKAKEKQCLLVAAQPVHGVVHGLLNKAYRQRLNKFDLVCPDGMPVKWALNLLHHCQLKDRVCGPDLTLKVCEEAAKNQVKVFFYGSKPEVVEALKTNLLQKFPKLQIAGTISPPFRLLTADEQADFLNQISTSGAGVLFVGMGCPKQEDWAYQHAKQLDMAVLCVGAAFDFHAGTVKRAPLWMQKNGLEWAFRLSQEPGRLFKRYAWYNSIFAICILAQWLRLWKPKAL
jgi:exopolysaccharide biosynthesis WecB/TagA/CpsF family protein